MLIIIIRGVPWLENDKMSLDTNWWVRCWATRRNEMCTTDLARRGLKPTMGVEEEEVINVFVILIIIIINHYHPTLHHNSHPQSHTVVTRSTGTRQKRSNNFSGLRTPSRASSTCLAWAPIHTRWSFLSSSAIFLHSYLFYFFFASLYILTSLYDYMYLFLARVSSTMATLMGWIRMILSQGGFLLILPFGNCVYGHFHLLSGVRIDQIYVRS